jgi:hypothetical protein
MAAGTGIIVFVGALCVAYLFSFAASRATKMREQNRLLAADLWYVSALFPLGIVCLYWGTLGDQPLSAQRIILGIAGAAVGCCLFLAAGEWMPPTTAASAQPSQSTQPSPVPSQNNQNGQNIIIPGSGNNLTVYPPPPAPSQTGSIYQAGIEVGKVFGARRSPSDATAFEFVEITNANQLNASEEFEFQSHILRLQRGWIERMTYGGVIGKIIRQK